MSKIFETDDGDQIPIDPQHFAFMNKTLGAYKDPKALYDFLKGASTNLSGGYDQVDQSAIKLQRHALRELSLHAYGARYVPVLIFLDLLASTGRAPRFERTLDIGCGIGIQPRILKGLGYADYAAGIDIIDRSSAIDTKSLMLNHRRFRRFRFIEPYLEKLDHEDWRTLSDFKRALAMKVSTPRRMTLKNQGYLLPADIYKKRLVKEPELDASIEGNVYDLEEQFDLITAYSSLEWFKLSEIFGKVSSLLTTGGLFYMYVGNWWASNSNTKISTHFPYARQRLSPQEFNRYVDNCFGADASETKAAYAFYDPEHPNFSDFIRLGLENGLVPIAHRCTILPHQFSHRYGMHAKGYALNDHQRFLQALAHIQKRRPDVRPEDLLTELTYIIFEKIDQGNTATAEYYQDALDELSFQYRPKNPVAKFLRRQGIRVLLGGTKE